MYDRLLRNCDIAISNSTSDWAYKFWLGTKEKLYQNMSDLGVLKDNRTIH